MLFSFGDNKFNPNNHPKHSKNKKKLTHNNEERKTPPEGQKRSNTADTKVNMIDKKTNNTQYTHPTTLRLASKHEGYMPKSDAAAAKTPTTPNYISASPKKLHSYAAAAATTPTTPSGTAATTSAISNKPLTPILQKHRDFPALNPNQPKPSITPIPITTPSYSAKAAATTPTTPTAATTSAISNKLLTLNLQKHTDFPALNPNQPKPSITPTPTPSYSAAAATTPNPQNHGAVTSANPFVQNKTK